MKILVACEESQEVCKRFRAKGHEAYSCDIIECSGGHPEWHIIHDVTPLLHTPCAFFTMDYSIHEIDHWDMIIAFPPCTYLTVSGNRWFNIEKYGEKALEREKDREFGINFFMMFANANCEKIAIENPIGIMSKRYKKPTQIIQPYYFGHKTRKTTCLWLKGLPKLNPTNMVEPVIEEFTSSDGSKKRYGVGIGNVKVDGKCLSWNNPLTAKLRSKTFPGVAQAMADQWG